MARLADGIAGFFDRLELLARGGEGLRKAAEEALSRGRPLEARDRARALLARAKGSAVGLALLADATEEAWLDDEAEAALRELAALAPWRADVWLRLGKVQLRRGDAEARETLERATASADPPEAVREALLLLADLDLAAGDAGRAERWLERVPARLSGGVAETGELPLRRAECALARGDLGAARAAAEGLAPGIDAAGRAELVRARLAHVDGQLALALDHALRAFVFDAPGAPAFLASLVASTHDAVAVGRVRELVEDTPFFDTPAFRAALARAEGRTDDARSALAAGLAAGDVGAARALLALAVEARDEAALGLLAADAPERLPPELANLVRAGERAQQGDVAAALDALDEVSGEAEPWARARSVELFRRWAPPGGAADVLALLGELARSARAVERPDLLLALEALGAAQQRPLRVAVVGEFNAGKSTFLNALLGEDVAPTGVLPTTATLHWVAWAPDAFARVLVQNGSDRVVPHAGLKAALKSVALAGGTATRVFIYAPIERLKRIELLDTPGFNAPDPAHLVAARSAFEEAAVVLWLFDATAPLKDSERRILAEAQALGVPVQVLVNKADRLAPPDHARVLEHVTRGLSESGIRSLGAPVLFSARLALSGRLGDAVALENSGFAAVEALLSERIVDASEALRERSFRRRALALARGILGELAARATRESDAQQVARASREAALSGAERLATVALDKGLVITAALAEPRRALARDLAPLAALATERKARDPGIRAYVEERVAARLSEPIAAAMLGLVGLCPTPADVAAVAGVLGGAAAVAEPVERLAGPFDDRLVLALAAALAGSLRAGATRSVARGEFAQATRRLEALVEVLASDADAP
jgi:small GTP-binding protein